MTRFKKKKIHIILTIDLKLINDLLIFFLIFCEIFIKTLTCTLTFRDRYQ